MQTGSARILSAKPSPYNGEGGAGNSQRNGTRTGSGIRLGSGARLMKTADGPRWSTSWTPFTVGTRRKASNPPPELPHPNGKLSKSLKKGKEAEGNHHGKGGTLRRRP